MNNQMSSALAQGDQTKVVLKVEGKQQFMGKEIPVVTGGFGEDNKVVTDKMVAEIHNTTSREIRKSINRNIKRFKENIDIIDLKIGGNEVTTLGYSKQETLQSENIYLLSERGYSKLIKIMDTDLAWEIHDKLIDDYFITREKKAELQNLSPQLQLLINMELEQKKMQEQLIQVNHHALQTKAEVKALETKVDTIKEVVSLDTTSWRTDTANLINKIATYRGGTQNIYQETRREIYELLDRRFGTNIERRLKNKKMRMAEEGICKSKRDKLSKIDVIAEDKKLIEGYLIIIKDMAIRYGV